MRIYFLYDQTCPWTTADECAMAAERAVAGTDAVLAICVDHAVGDCPGLVAACTQARALLAQLEDTL